jgi:dipeptidyl-peptidase-3
MMLLSSCGTQQEQMERSYSLERVGPARVVQLYADGFENLSAQERIFIFYLSRAALAARDITIDQHHRFALEIRDLLEGIVTQKDAIEPAVYESILTYTKLFWINNGPYDNITSRKVLLECNPEQLHAAAEAALAGDADLGLGDESLNAKLDRVSPVLFDPAFEPIMTNKTPGEDWIKSSAINFYGRELTLSEVERWARSGRQRNDLNAKLVKRRGRIAEEVWRAGGNGTAPGLYASDLNAAIAFLEQAIPWASGPYQQETIRKLIRYFRTGEIEDFRQFNIHWVGDTSRVDFINGFIEVYLDPRGEKAEYEASAFWADEALTRSIRAIASNVQYFEDRMPWDPRYKKADVKPLEANVVNVALATGGTGPVSPIGINLPNEQMIRERYGSKSVVLFNIMDAAEKAGGQVLINEFAFDQQERDLQFTHGTLAANVHTALHEVLGHASGKTMVAGDPSSYLPGYYSTLEETRADLVALWHIWDEKLTDIGAIPSIDVAKQMYNAFVRNALLLQLRRIPEGDQIEEDHMKNRQLIANYVLKNSDAITLEKRDGKTYVRILDYGAMRVTIGALLAEVMRIKAEGDLAAAQDLVNTYGLKIDTILRDEVLERIKPLDVASYNGYVMPDYVLITDDAGNAIDAMVSYPGDLMSQMLSYSAFTKKAKAPHQAKQ